MMLAAKCAASIDTRGTAVAPWSFVARSGEESVAAFRTHGIARQKDAPENIMNFINGLRTFVRNEEGQDLLDTRCSWR